MGPKPSFCEGLHEPAYHVQYIGPLRIESNAGVDDPLRQSGVNPFYRISSAKLAFQRRRGMFCFLNLDIHFEISDFCSHIDAPQS